MERSTRKGRRRSGVQAVSFFAATIERRKREQVRQRGGDTERGGDRERGRERARERKRDGEKRKII